MVSASLSSTCSSRPTKRPSTATRSSGPRLRPAGASLIKRNGVQRGEGRGPVCESRLMRRGIDGREGVGRGLGGDHRRLAQLLCQAMVDNLRLDHGAAVGGPDRDRTGDLINAIDARSQLRYRPPREAAIVSRSGAPDQPHERARGPRRGRRPCAWRRVPSVPSPCGGGA